MSGYLKAVLTGLWAVFFGLKVIDPVMEASAALAGHLPGFISRALVPSLVIWPARLLLMLALAGLFAFALARAGGILWRLWGIRADGAALAVSLKVLLGFGLLGSWYLGLVLTGLFYPFLIIGSVVAVLVLPGICREIGEIASISVPWRSWWWLIFGPFLLILALAVAPDVHVAVSAYHLAAPSAFLASHRFLTLATVLGFQFPLMTELIYSLAIILGNDALTHFIQLVPYMAAVILVSRWVAKEAGPSAQWLAAALMLTLGIVEMRLLVAKNILPAAALPMGGAICIARGLVFSSRRWLSLGAALLGCAGGIKYSAYPLMVLGFLAAEISLRSRGKGNWRTTLIMIVALAVPAGAWRAKAWLIMGDPLIPLLAPWLPGAIWDEHATQAMRLIQGNLGFLETMVSAGPSWINLWSIEQPLVGLMLPAMLLLGAPGKWRIGWLVGYSISGYFILYFLMPQDVARMGLPILALWAGMTGATAARLIEYWPKGGKGASLVAIGLLCWIPLPQAIIRSRAYTDMPALVDYLAGRIDRKAYLTCQITSQASLSEIMRGLPDIKGYISLGNDPATYRYPGRSYGILIRDRNWAWLLARECSTAAEIRKRLRQLNCRHVTYNFIMESFPQIYYSFFPWGTRELLLWYEFVSRYLDVIAVSADVDQESGGFCLYRVRDVPLKEEPPYIPYFPGIASVYAVITWQADDPLKYIDEARRLYERFPRVDYIRNRLAVGHYRVGEYREAYALLKEGLSHGTIDDMNIWNAAACAERLGRIDEAIELIKLAARVYARLGDVPEISLEKLKRKKARMSGDGE